VRLSIRTARRQGRLIARGATATVTALALLAIGVPATALAATTVNYSVSPSGGSVQPDATIGLTLTVNTTVAIAGGSIHVALTNAGYVSFQTAGSASLSFVDYHADQSDILFICNNNNCAPGTYPIATINVKAGQTGSAQATFTPKETADPQLNEIGATGLAVSFTINANAPAATVSGGSGSSTKSTYTVPQDGAAGGTAPQQVTSDQLAQQTSQAQQQFKTGALTDGQKFWSSRNLILGGVAGGLGFAILLFLAIRLLKRFTPSDPFGPGGPMV